MYTSDRIAAAHAAWIETYVALGWNPYLLTLKFDHIPGSERRVEKVMRAETERAYAILLTRATRRPRSVGQQGNLPIWICCFDMPVFKRAKPSIRDILPNDGRHVHATLLMPPWSRFQDVEEHFLQLQHVYLGASDVLAAIDCVPVTYTPGYAHQYVMKAVLNGRLDEASWFVLPKSLSELE
jgi:hypothetical protein